MLTRGRGKVRAVAKGVRRTKSKFGARLEPGMHVDLQCYEGRNLDTVTQAESLDPWGDQIARDYSRWTAASAMLETADRLTEEGIPVTLALSLHAPDDELRDELVPINTRYKVDEAIDSAHRYFQATGRRVSIEYALIRDINDQGWRADLLGKKLAQRGRGWVHVNPIPLNPTPGSKWTASRPGVEQNFVERLRAHGIPTTVRDTRGSDIDGACGQLAAAS